MGADRSYSKDENGQIQQTNYTEERDDGKTETRHYDRSGAYTGKTVSGGDKSEHYNRNGGKT